MPNKDPLPLDLVWLKDYAFSVSLSTTWETELRKYLTNLISINEESQLVFASYSAIDTGK